MARVWIERRRITAAQKKALAAMGLEHRLVDVTSARPGKTKTMVEARGDWTLLSGFLGNAGITFTTLDPNGTKP